MPRFIVTTVNDTYETYEVEAENAAEAERKVEDAFDTPGDTPEKIALLRSGAYLGVGDREEVIDVQEVED